MTKREKAEIRFVQLVMLLLALTLVSFWMLGNLYARYATQASGSDSARVAAFQITDSNDVAETYQIYPSMTGEEQQKVAVQIQNSSEVAVRYTFSFDTDGNLPLVITGNSPEGTTLTKATDTENSWTIEKAAGSGWNETYTFALSLDNTSENYQYAGGVESMTLTVLAEQID